jgi:hypothetical protein
MASHQLLTTSVLATLLAGPAVQGQKGGTGCDTAAPLPRSISADSVDVLPEVTYHPQLTSPPRLAMAGMTDDVLIEYDVDSTGAVDRCSIRVLQAKRPEFAASASEYVSRLQFAPGLQRGVAVRTRIQQHVLFWQTNGARGKHHIF